MIKVKTRYSLLVFTWLLLAIGAAGCKTLSKAADDGKITGRELMSGGESSKNTQDGASNSSTDQTKKALSNAPDPQRDWKEVRQTVKVGGKDVKISMGEKAKLIASGKPRCRWIDYQVSRSHEGGGNYAPADYYAPYQWPEENIDCSEARSAKSDSSAMAVLSDDDTVAAAKWTSDWAINYEDGNPVEKVRRLRAYHLRTDKIGPQLPFPDRKQLKRLVAKAAFKFTTDKHSSNYARVDAIRVSPDVGYRVSDRMDGSYPELVVEISELRFTYVDNGSKSSRQFTCNGDDKVVIRVVSAEREHYDKLHVIESQAVDANLMYDTGGNRDFGASDIGASCRRQ